MAAAVGIAYLDGARLRRSLIAAADWVDAGREELNRINVFPVPDGDTGTNFASTLRAVATRVRGLSDDASLPQVCTSMAEACVLAARGNSGMLLSQFLLGFRDAIGAQDTADASDVAAAIRAGADRLSASLDEPVEGTILTVAREVASAAERAAGESADFEDLMRRVLTEAERALAETPDLLAALKEAGVVDAGAKAFVRVLEGIVRLIEGDPIVSATGPISYEVPDAAALAEVAHERDYQFCTEVLIRGSQIPPSAEARVRLRPLGGSIVVLAAGDLLKLHIHTDAPHDVFALAAEWGAVESTKADDMRLQHQQLHDGRRAVGVVADSSCDLPDDLLDRHGIVLVPLQVIEGNRTFQDRFDLTGGTIYAQMREGTIFTTSQPTPGAFARAFEDAKASSDTLVCVLLAKALSGTFAAGQAAARAVGGDIVMVDSRTASLGLGLLVLRAAELAERGVSASEIAKDLERTRDASGALFTVDTFENLLRSGRVGRGRAWLGTLLDVKPILEVNREGRIVPLDRVRGRDALLPRVLHHLDRRFAARGTRRLRVGVAHADAPDVAQRVQAELVARYAPDQIIIADVTAVIGVHAGPGAWAIFYQMEEPEPPAGTTNHQPGSTDRPSGTRPDATR